MGLLWQLLLAGNATLRHGESWSEIRRTRVCTQSRSSEQATSEEKQEIRSSSTDAKYAKPNDGTKLRARFIEIARRREAAGGNSGRPDPTFFDPIVQWPNWMRWLMRDTRPAPTLVVEMQRKAEQEQTGRSPPNRHRSRCHRHGRVAAGVRYTFPLPPRAAMCVCLLARCCTCWLDSLKV